MTISAFTIGNGAMVIIPQKMFSGVYNFTYMCIPLFILASEIMSRCGLTMSIVKFCDTLVGHIRGGLAHVNILASMLFAGNLRIRYGGCFGIGSYRDGNDDQSRIYQGVFRGGYGGQRHHRTDYPAQ